MIDEDGAGKDVGEDRLRGAGQIAAFLQESVRRVRYLAERGILPVGKEGSALVASKARLRAYHRRITGGETT
jgi:hypothetical protein